MVARVNCMVAKETCIYGVVRLVLCSVVARGNIPDQSQLLDNDDIIMLKRCIFASQVCVACAPPQWAGGMAKSALPSHLPSHSPPLPSPPLPSSLLSSPLSSPPLQRVELPAVVTHNVIDDGNDPVLNHIRRVHLYNHREDRVKVGGTQIT